MIQPSSDTPRITPVRDRPIPYPEQTVIGSVDHAGVILVLEVTEGKSSDIIRKLKFSLCKKRATYSFLVPYNNDRPDEAAGLHSHDPYAQSWGGGVMQPRPAGVPVGTGRDAAQRRPCYAVE